MTKHKLRLLGSIASLLIAALWLATGARADGPHRVGVVVCHGDGTTVTRCISFDEPDLSGYEALERSDLAVESISNPSQGVAVCRIDGEGCSTGNCFCDMPNYWTYWNLVDGAWRYAAIGASARRVQDGDVDCWLWGTGAPPPVPTIEEICGWPETICLPLIVTPHAAMGRARRAKIANWLWRLGVQ